MNKRTINILSNVVIFVVFSYVVGRFFKDPPQKLSAATKRPWPSINENELSPSEPPKTYDQKSLGTRNYYIVFDASGSMSMSGCSGSQDKMSVAKASLLAFSKAVPPGANLGLTVFDGGGVREVVPLGGDNRTQFDSAVMNLTPGGSTPLKSAMALGAKKLEDQARRQLSYGEYNLVVVTDGEADKGEDPRPVVDDLLLNSPVVIHTIGFCIGKNHSLNQPQKILFKAASEPEQLTKGLEDVLAESESFDVASFKAP